MSFNDYLSASYAIHDLNDLIFEDFQNLGLKGVVLDFDGVLSSFSKTKPELDKIEWAHKLSQKGIFVAIHSNNNRFLEEKRKSWLRTHYPNILWMPSKPYKPNPSTLLHLRQRWKLDAKELVMIDDRFLTGGKAAYRAGSQFIYIKNPLIDRKFAPWGELWFSLLRMIERSCYTLPQILLRTREDSNL